MASSALFSLLHIRRPHPPPTTPMLHFPVKNRYGCLNFGDIKQQRYPTLRIIGSVLSNSKSSISDGSGNGATEPARVLLERLFAQTQKLEQQISKDSSLTEDEQLNLNLEALESDLQAALFALRKKEEDLQYAENIVQRDYAELDKVRQELEQRKEEISSAYIRQKELEEELGIANDSLVSEAQKIEDLKLLMEERDQDIFEIKSAVSIKEDELNMLREEMMRKDEEAFKMSAELDSRNQLLNEANEIIKTQEAKLHELQILLTDKEHELAKSTQQREDEAKKLKLAEANLEKRTLEWLSAREELKNLAKEASKNMSETRETMRSFKKVRSLLIDVKAELVASQRLLASSHGKMKEQEDQLNEQLEDVNALKQAVMLHTASVKDAQFEIEKEQSKLRDEVAQKRKLEQKLSAEKELVRNLEEQLNKERMSLEELTQTISVLQKELDQKVLEFAKSQSLLQVKESELVEARLEIQHLKSEQASFQHMLAEKDSSLLTAQKALEEVTKEVVELKELMTGKENQLIQAAQRLKDKEELVDIIRNELDETKVRYDEATSVVERITQLTNQLVISTKDENANDLSQFGEEFESSTTIDHNLDQSTEKSSQAFEKERQLKVELGMVKDRLRMKEMELLAAERALAIKEQELEAIFNRLNGKEEEMKKMKLNMDGLKKLYELAQKTIGDKSVGDLVIEKLQLEATQLEAEAATCALQNIVDLSHELLKETHAVLNFDRSNDVDILSKDFKEMDEERTANVCYEVAKAEVARLLSVSEQLVRDAGISSAEDQSGEPSSVGDVDS